MAAVCDKDCFHCPYPDCINDEMDHEDYVASAQRDKELRATPKSKKLAAQQKAYYEANREKVAAQQKAYYEANREKLAAQKKAYYEANREKVAAQQKAIRQVRQELGLSLRAAAGLLNVSDATVSFWESGGWCPAMQVVLYKPCAGERAINSCKLERGKVDCYVLQRVPLLRGKFRPVTSLRMMRMKRKSNKQMPCPYYCGQAQNRIICKDRRFVQFFNEIEKNRFSRSRCMNQRYRCNIYNAILERERQAGGKK